MITRFNNKNNNNKIMTIIKINSPTATTMTIRAETIAATMAGKATT
jgi:hypothetical protein